MEVLEKHETSSPAWCHCFERSSSLFVHEENILHVACKCFMEKRPVAIVPLSYIAAPMTARTANTDDEAHVDVCARGFWNVSQDAFFDVRVFYPNASFNY